MHHISSTTNNITVPSAVSFSSAAPVLANKILSDAPLFMAALSIFFLLFKFLSLSNVLHAASLYVGYMKTESLKSTEIQNIRIKLEACSLGFTAAKSTL